jgi:hypothetical protein
MPDIVMPDYVAASERTLRTAQRDGNSSLPQVRETAALAFKCRMPSIHGVREYVKAA